MNRIQTSIENLTKTRTTESRIWKSFRHQDVARKIGDFLWRCAHDSLRIGAFWKNVAGCEQRAICVCCGTEESIEHILVECRAEATVEIRRLLALILRKKKDRVIPLTLGTLLGATAFTYATKDEASTAAADRLFRIAVSESVYLIWKLRCERTIEHGDAPDSWHTAAEARAKWYACMNRRLALERTLTSRRLGEKALDRAVIENTWSGVLNLPDQDQTKWLGVSGVLVGKLDNRNRNG
ncbi:hypothetical protein OH76DRAFT_1338688 [Lentinus brumalis]|uniref:Reverse transcriptase zinc-binding domain-containing protein n=1 Tax=Lentinus brumalis TaxID=2498619 RepID=A0A371DSZ8_9APHY|nr:hypothetical protein OH76DRAFT_1338688 [Polyporus brumalis]